jgi:WD40 repeat protein
VFFFFLVAKKFFVPSDNYFPFGRLLSLAMALLATFQPEFYATCCAFHPTLPLVAVGGAGGELELWHAVDGKMLRRYRDDARDTTLFDWIRACAFAGDGRRLVVLAGSCCDYDFDTNTLRQLYFAGGRWLAVSPDGRWCAFQRDANVIISDSRETRCGMLPLAENSVVTCAAFTPHGLLAVGFAAGGVALFDVPHAGQRLTLVGADVVPACVEDMALDAAGQRVVFLTHNQDQTDAWTVCSVSLDSHQVRVEFRVDPAFFSLAALRPPVYASRVRFALAADSDCVFYAQDAGSLPLYDPERLPLHLNQLRNATLLHRGELGGYYRSIKFSPDGVLLATIDSHSVVRVFDVTSTLPPVHWASATFTAILAARRTNLPLLPPEVWRLITIKFLDAADVPRPAWKG